MEQLPDAGRRMRSVRLYVSLDFSMYALLPYNALTKLQNVFNTKQREQELVDLKFFWGFLGFGFFLILNQKWRVFTSQRRGGILNSPPAMAQVRGGCAAALFLTPTLLFNPIESVNQTLLLHRLAQG